MFVSLGNIDMAAVLVDTQTGTVLEASHVVAIPADVWNENGMEEDHSDSFIADFGKRYGVPIFVEVS